jgi:hypothetical protein
MGVNGIIVVNDKLTVFWGWVPSSLLIKWRWTLFKPNVGFTDSTETE